MPTDGYESTDGFIYRLPFRGESNTFFIHGTVDAEKMWEEFKDEPFTPILVGGRAVVGVVFHHFTDSDVGGAVYETCYSTFVSRKS